MPPAPFPTPQWLAADSGQRTVGNECLRDLCCARIANVSDAEAKLHRAEQAAMAKGVVVGQAVPNVLPAW